MLQQIRARQTQFCDTRQVAVTSPCTRTDGFRSYMTLALASARAGSDGWCVAWCIDFERQGKWSEFETHPTEDSEVCGGIALVSPSVTILAEG